MTMKRHLLFIFAPICAIYCREKTRGTWLATTGSGLRRLKTRSSVPEGERSFSRVLCGKSSRWIQWKLQLFGYSQWLPSHNSVEFVYYFMSFYVPCYQHCRPLKALVAAISSRACFFHTCPLDHWASWPSQDFNEVLGSMSWCQVRKSLQYIDIVWRRMISWIMSKRELRHGGTFAIFSRQAELGLALRSHEHPHRS